MTKYVPATTQAKSVDDLRRYTVDELNRLSVSLNSADASSDPTNPSTPAGSVVVLLSRSSATIFSYANGTSPSYEGIDGFCTVYDDGVDVTSQATFSATGTNVTGTINDADGVPVAGKAKGYYRVTNLAANNGQLAITVVYKSKTYNVNFSVSRSTAGFEIVNELPTTNLFEGRMVFLTTDGKLYRYHNGAWTTAVPALDIAGLLADAQIAGLAASKVTGQLTDAQIAAVNAAKLTGEIDPARIADGTIAGTKFASGIKPIEVVGTLPLTGTTGQVVFLTTDSKLYRWSGSGWTATVPSADISGTIESAQIAALEATKITGEIVGTQISNGAISSPKIQTGAITAGKIAAGAIQAGDIAAGTITGDKIAADTITASNILSNTITAGQIAAGAITASELAAGAVTAGKIAANSITSLEIASAAVTTAKLAAGAVVADTIAANAITTPKIEAGAITTAKVAAGAIQTLQIDALAVNADKIQANAIVAEKIAANAITTDKIEAGAITAAKLATTELITLSAQIKDGIITNAKIGDLTADKITAGVINTSRLNIDGITLANIGGVLGIPSSGVGSTQITPGAVTAANFALAGDGMSLTTTSFVVVQSISFTLTEATIAQLGGSVELACFITTGSTATSDLGVQIAFRVNGGSVSDVASDYQSASTVNFARTLNTRRVRYFMPGTYTVDLMAKLTATGSTNNVTVAQRYLEVTLLKR